MTRPTPPILLVFPPHWAFTMPHLALPCLHGALASAGHDALLLDANLDFHRWLFSARGVREMAWRIQRRIDHLDATPTLSAPEAAGLRGLVVGATLAQRVMVDIDDAIATLRSDLLFEPEYVARATGCLKDAYSLVGKAFAPSRMDFVSFYPKGDACTRDGLDEIVRSEDANPYRAFFAAHTLPLVRNVAPRLVGISIAAETQWVPALTLCAMLRESGCPAAVVLGGGVVTRLADELATRRGALDEYCDCIVIGEGEEPIVALADRVSRGQGICDVPNSIAYLTDGAIRRNPAVPHALFRLLPPPRFSGMPLDEYFTPEPVLPVMLARGCYHRCAFCDHSSAYSARRSARKPADVAAEIRSLQQQYGTRSFAFADEALPPAAFRMLALALNGSCGPRLAIAASFRGDASIADADWTAFANAGLRLAQFGIESGSQRVLDSMCKGTTVESNRSSLQLAAEAGVWNHGFIMFGFPGETRDDVAETVAFVQQNNARLHSVGASRFHLMRQSAIAAIPGSFGVDVGEAGIWSLVRPHVAARGIGVEDADAFCGSFNRDTVPCLRGAPLWQQLERSQLLLYLERHGRERTLALGEQLRCVGVEGADCRPRMPIDLELRRLHHDVTVSNGVVGRIREPVPILSDGPSRSVALLSQGAWEAVTAWRGGSTLAAAARRVAMAADADHDTITTDCSRLWSDLSLAIHGDEHEEAFVTDECFVDIRRAAGLPEELPIGALPELVGVISGLKPGARFTLYGEKARRVAAISNGLGRLGLSIRLGELRSDGLDHLSPSERAAAHAAAPVQVYVARTGIEAEQLKKAEGCGATVFGHALGYPECCVRWLAEQDKGTPPGTRPPNLVVRTFESTAGHCYAELNNLLWHLPDGPSPFYLTSHYPCSYCCKASRALAMALYFEIERRSTAAARALARALARPAVVWDDASLPPERWDENKGVVFDGTAKENRVRFRRYLSLRRERDYSDLGLAYSDEIIVTADRVRATHKGATAGCWWTEDHGRAYVLDFASCSHREEGQHG